MYLLHSHLKLGDLHGCQTIHQSWNEAIILSNHRKPFDPQQWENPILYSRSKEGPTWKIWNNSIEKTYGLVYNKAIDEKQIWQTWTNDNHWTTLSRLLTWDRHVLFIQNSFNLLESYSVLDLITFCIRNIKQHFHKIPNEKYIFISRINLSV